jgi:hypothetical protein
MSLHQRPRILKADEIYTFRKYFDLKFAPADILRELGVSLIKEKMNLPVGCHKVPGLEDLQRRLEEAIKRVSLTSEVARITESTINIEYPIEVNQYLRGDLDYYLQSQEELLVVEAKQADLTRGFTQLAIALIAVDQWSESERPILYGAVTTGDIWQFGSFQRQNSLISQDLMLYRVPTDLETLMQILVGLLTSRESAAVY